MRRRAASGADAYNAVVGEIERIAYRPMPYYALRDIADPSARRRALDQLRHYMAIYYNVYRTEAARLIAEEILEHDFSGLEIHEYFGAARTATLGKIKSHSAYLAYFRQGGISSQFAWKVDWVDNLLRSRFPRLFAVKQRLTSLKPRRILPPRMRRALDERRFWRQLAAHGADVTTMSAHAAELREIEATLQGDAFLTFVRANAPGLLPRGTRPERG